MSVTPDLVDEKEITVNRHNYIPDPVLNTNGRGIYENDTLNTTRKHRITKIKIGALYRNGQLGITWC